jgi:4-hydroxy-3-polyprenylbenzoate decarboxylase
MNKIIIAVTGASGAVYARLLLDNLLKLKGQFKDIALVISENAKKIWQSELGNEDYKNYPVAYYDKFDFSAPFASGSAQYNIMIVIPCSMGTLGRIASGISDDLVTRAADVILKERRKLILAVRDTPYNLIHIKNMETITLAGGIICPATPSFYSNPTTIEEVALTVVNRIIDIAGLQSESFRWGEK